ncbi:S41 family peptidase [Anaeromyxobacter oryzae]|uniref:Tail specific protease domain-containing protein n=1 Tax=Anaeromyxobacter oryzae TaxID=2918170 RepID=A0ABM7X135_9BACT|nr:S41 family peptidase [Anaeromyxobacter oryzae]BDG05475.1 hypothetical protein AMOR_44710 [Anaeromyxobacter oryzae]
MTTALLLLATALATAAPAPAARAADALATAAPAAVAPASVATSTVAPDADACRSVDELETPASCGDAPLCSARKRVRIACELRDAMESRYVFESVKARMLAADGRPAFDARRHLEACAAAERAIPAEDDPLRFYDRMRRCTAAFEDGHLILTVPRGIPQVALGVSLRLTADGQVRVAHRDPGLVTALDAVSRATGAPGSAALAVGTRVVAVDGRPVEALVDELGRYVPASSEGARRERAVDALTRRSFAFPARRTATLTVERGGSTEDVTLTWWLSPGGETHPLTVAFARRTGVRSSAVVDWRPEASGAWLRDGDAEGLVRGDPIVPPDDAARLQAWRGDRGQLAVRLGDATPPGAPRFCYAQILTFHTETLATGDEAARPFPAVLEDFVHDCAERHLDLVLDLRQNEGGYINHSTALAALLTPPNQTSPGGVLLLRATAQTERVYRERAPMLGGEPTGAPAQESSEPQRILRAIEDARRDRREFTPAFFDPPLRSSAEFGGRVVALVSPTCMSACDRIAAMLKGAGRAVLVGGPTEGAGASQQEARGLSVRWSDADGLLAVAIPNAAMGVQPAPSGGARDATADEFFAALAFENRPVEPQVHYATRLEDLTGHNRGWLEQTVAALRVAPAVAHAPDPTAAR